MNTRLTVLIDLQVLADSALLDTERDSQSNQITTVLDSMYSGDKCEQSCNFGVSKQGVYGSGRFLKSGALGREACKQQINEHTTQRTPVSVLHAVCGGSTTFTGYR